MAVTAKLYGKALLSILNKEIDWNSDNIKVAFCDNTYTPDQDAHDYFNDITGELANGNGYTSGGFTLASCTATYTGATNTLKLDANDVSVPSFTGTFRYLIVYDATPGTAATNPLIGYVDCGADVTATAGTVDITWDAAGIFTAVAA